MATVGPKIPFDPESAAQELRSAMKGIGTNEDEITAVVAYHTNAQRQEIKHKYKQMFGRDLDQDIKSETGGYYLLAVESALTLPVLYDVRELHHAMHGAGTKESVLTEILSTRYNAEIEAIKQYYEKEYDVTLEEALTNETSDNFRHLVVSLCNANREETNLVNEGRALEDAKRLFEAGERKFGTDEEMFNYVLCTRGFPQLQATFRAYLSVAGHDIEQAVASETSGDLQTGYLTIIKCAKNIAEYFAERIYHAMKGAGTNDREMIRIIVSRSEIDLAIIRQEFHRLYNQELRAFVEGECSGDYRKFLLHFIP